MTSTDSHNKQEGVVSGGNPFSCVDRHFDLWTTETMGEIASSLCTSNVVVNTPPLKRQHHNNDVVDNSGGDNDEGKAKELLSVLPDGHQKVILDAVGGAALSHLLLNSPAGQQATHLLKQMKRKPTTLGDQSRSVRQRLESSHVTSDSPRSLDDDEASSAGQEEEPFLQDLFSNNDNDNNNDNNNDNDNNNKQPLGPQERAEQRKERNREIARRSRQKKKLYVQSLEDRIRELECQQDAADQQLNVLAIENTILKRESTNLTSRMHELSQENASLRVRYSLIQNGRPLPQDDFL